MRILHVRTNENLTHARDRPKLVFLCLQPGSCKNFRLQVMPSLGYSVAMFPVLREW